ncbi:MAG: cytochrome c biogenesis protein CcsA, partial [Phycisphaeraceae bacterium]
LGVILITFLSWLVWRGPLLTAANRLLVLTWLVHTVALAVRVYLSGRPPVTNLYSSAVFIGWGCVVLCLILERVFRNGVGTFTAATTGTLTLLVARALSGDGDSMAVLQAVLDTNFWLATHVVVITLGYSATFLAGVLGIIFVFRGVFTNTLSKDSARSLGQMIYGIICFATLFSFVGTILGGIWADQSWGRFWGWDPKENGALMIVLWNVLLLHARWGGMVKLRGMAVLAIFGNVVTSWSWFGVNMLGAGLHSYGFIESAVFWLLLFVLSQLVMIGIGCLPLGGWCSFSAVAPQRLPEAGSSESKPGESGGPFKPAHP